MSIQNLFKSIFKSEAVKAQSDTVQEGNKSETKQYGWVKELVDVLTPKVFKNDTERESMINKVLSELEPEVLNKDIPDLIPVIQERVAKEVLSYTKPNKEESKILVLPGVPEILNDISFYILKDNIYNDSKGPLAEDESLKELISNIRLGFYNDSINEWLEIINSINILERKVSFNTWSDFKEYNRIRNNSDYSFLINILATFIYGARYKKYSNFESIIITPDNIKTKYLYHLYNRCKDKLIYLPDEIRLELLTCIASIYRDKEYTDKVSVLYKLHLYKDSDFKTMYENILSVSKQYGLSHVNSLYSILTDKVGV